MYRWIILAVFGCGNNITTLEATCAEESQIPILHDNEEVEAGHSTDREVRDSDREDDRTANQSVNSSVELQALCLSPSPELARPVRAAVQRFAERLEIPMVVGEGCVPVTVRETVSYRGKPQSGLARYRGSRACVFDECNTRASIQLESALLGPKAHVLENVLDHEIGHILSAWGSVAGVNMHLPAGNLMAGTVSNTSIWTQADIDLWCGASPCGKTLLDPSWQTGALPPPGVVADGGHLESFDVDSGATGPDGGPED